MNEIINVGLIGYGLAGRVFHLPIISSIQGLKLYKVYETKKDREAHIKSKCPDIKITSNIDEMFQDDNIQLIVIAAPNAYHYNLAFKALESGKNVVVEKPFTVTTEEADKLIELAKMKNKILTVHQNRRWDSDFRTVEKVIRSNCLGNIVEYEAHFDRFRNQINQNDYKEKNLPGSGFLYNLGSHLIDQALYLFGVPETVFGNLQVQRPGGEIIDNFEIILSYPNLKVTLKSGMLVKEQGPRFTILGTKGSFIKYGTDIQEEHLSKGILPNNVSEWGKEPENLWGRINTEINGLNISGKVESEAGDYREFYKNVYGAILGEDTLEVTPVQARNCIRIIELVQRSDKERRWIEFQ